MYNTKI